MMVEMKDCCRPLAIGAVLLALVASTARATENSSTHVSFGFNDTLVGLPPAPGFYVRDDVEIVISGRDNDGNGRKLAARLGPGNTLALKYRESDQADIFSVAYVPDWKVPYINATIGAAAFDNFANARIGVTSRLGLPQARGQFIDGFGDINVAPVFLGFDIPSADLHFVVAPLTFVAPIGRYSPGRTANLGLNYFTYRPSVGITYLNKTGQEISLNLGYFTNTRNETTRYRSGDEFSLNYVFEQFFSPKYAAGIGGYWYKQIGDDRQNNRVVNSVPAADILNHLPGNRGEVFAIGPVLSYNPSNTLAFNAHWEHEVYSFNRTQRELIYVRGTMRF